GLAGGLIGTFLFLRKRALMGDVLSHAMLPGIAGAFMVMVALGGDGKALPGLLLGAAVFGLLGVGCVLA
ncbi:metal ABC transporter permease, partial [Hydrogenophaga sp.]|uniref:metal ABC transporter permease n=1 Tax=Hydrogenophaga sp. TaxID=1904254 RepID=UPI0025C177AF